MGRMIIEYDDDISPLDTIEYIRSVISLGRISGNEKCYCYGSRFTDDTVVFADLTKTGTDKFIVRRENNNAN